ncbi:MAG: gamma-glutamylcyclotransferase [Gemmatimonadetes bacterium]|nr:gamma-glutamylcyclotransferase [Gemmatimonadota bacterium]
MSALEAGAGRTFYFAYGSNMDVAAMATRCPGARVVGPARLGSHGFLVNRNHHGTVMPAAGKAVHGLLWSITDDDQRALDEYEGVAIALYRRHQVRVTLHDGREVEALTYMARNVEPTRTSGAYYDQLLATARTLGFPPEYVAELEGWRLPDAWERGNPGTGPG